MTKKKENYELGRIERIRRNRARNARRKAKIKAKKEAARTWKAGCLVTFKTLDSNRKWKIFICRFKKIPNKFDVHYCTMCRMINGCMPCLNIHTDTFTKCNRKRAHGTFPVVIGRFDKHNKYHSRTVVF